MADKYAAGIWAGKTSVSHNFILRSNVDSTEVTGKVAADMTASYWRQGGSRTAITLSDLAAITTAHGGASGGGVKEVDATNMPGLYRLDLPDAAVASGVDWVVVSVKVNNCFVYHERIPLGTDQPTAIAAIKAVTDTLTVVGGKISAAITTAADFVQAAADKVWLTSSRPVTSVPTVSLTTSVWDEPAAGHTTAGSMGAALNAAAVDVWDEVAASHNTAGSMGAKLNTAATAGDPWAVAVPGAYGAGTAGKKLSDIEATTAQITFPAAGKIGAMLQAAGDFPQACADKVWASATRTLTSLGTLVTDVTTAVWAAGSRTLTSFGGLVASVVAAVWDELSAAHNPAGATGNKLNAAASAGDPWSTALPGAYAAGSAGATLAALGGDHALIVAIDGKTSQLTFSGGAVQATGGVSESAIANAVWNKVLETQGAVTAQQILSVGLAVLAGVTTDGGATFKTPNGASIRVTAIVNSSNERAVVALSPSAPTP